MEVIEEKREADARDESRRLAVAQDEEDAARESQWKDCKDQEHRVRWKRPEEEYSSKRRDDRKLAAMERGGNVTTRVRREKRKVIDGVKEMVQ